MEKNRGRDAALIAALCIFLVLTAGEIFLKLYFKEGISVTVLYIIAAVQAVVFTVPSVILFKKQKLSASRFFQLRHFKVSWLPAIFLAAMCATFGAALINLFLYSLPFSHIFRSATFTVTGEGSAFAQILAFIVFPAFFEELFIHGALLSDLKNRGITKSVLICAFVFAMLHSSAANFLGPLFAAVIYGYLTVIFQSVWPAIIAHFINNVVSDYAGVLVDKYINIGMNGYIIFIAAILLLLCIGGLCSMLLKHLKTVRVTVGQPDITKNQFSIALGILAFLWAVKIALDVINVI